MKKYLIIIAFLLLPWRVFGADFYIDSGVGDGGVGSEGDPFNDISDLSLPLSADDNVYLKRGGSWREALPDPGANGSDGSPITFGAYSSGADPLIIGSDSYSAEGDWNEEAGDLWETVADDVDWTVKAVWDNGSPLIRETVKNDLDIGEWWYDDPNNRLYIKKGSNPGTGTIEIAHRNGVTAHARTWIVYDGIEFNYSDFGIQFWNGGSDSIIQNCVVEDAARDAINANGGPTGNADRISVLNNTVTNYNAYMAGRVGAFDCGDGDVPCRYGINIISNDGTTAEDTIITGNTITNTYTIDTDVDNAGINIDQQGHASLINKNSVTASNNNNMSCIAIWQMAGTGKITVRENKCINNGGFAISFQEADENSFADGIDILYNYIENANNDDGSDRSAIRIWPVFDSDTITVAHNIINGTYDGGNAHHGIRVRHTTGTDVYIYGNTIDGADDGILIDSTATVAALQNNSMSNNRDDGLDLDVGGTITLRSLNSYFNITDADVECD